MKLYLKISSFIVLTAAWWGILIPHFVSASDDISLVIGALFVLVYPVITRIWFKTEFKSLKMKMDGWK